MASNIIPPALSSASSGLTTNSASASSTIFDSDNSTYRVSVDAAGAEGNGESFAFVVFSPDGTKIAFSSVATNLVPGDTNGSSDIFIKDLITGGIARVSTDQTGAQGNSDSFGSIAFSPDGTKIAFVSNSSNLVGNDTNSTLDVFLKDLTTGAITLLSSSAAGVQGATNSDSVSFSPDGTRVAFCSLAPNLVAGDTNRSWDIFVKDLLTGAIVRVSTGATGVQGNYSSQFPVFSPDGTSVAFSSDASNLVAGDTNFMRDFFAKNLVTGAIVRVSTDAAGMQANGSSEEYIAFSPDGGKVVFSSQASNLVSGDTGFDFDIFVKDLATGAITRVSTGVTGMQANGSSINPVFSPDGTKVAFVSYASNLLPGDISARCKIIESARKESAHWEQRTNRIGKSMASESASRTLGG